MRATFVLDSQRWVRLSCVEPLPHRAGADEVLACVRGQTTAAAKPGVAPRHVARAAQHVSLRSRLAAKMNRPPEP